VKTRKRGTALRQLHALFNVGVVADCTDGQLLERFSTGRGESAELAFAALVERHGPMVMRVCRALSTDSHDAQDAFQATFLVLVRKARTLWVRDSLGPWLYQVAFRTASCARLAAARRRKHERCKAESHENLEWPVDPTGFEWERVLHEEIDRLPEHYRVPIVLCDLQGHTCEDAARRMGRPVGTVKSWRSRGRERLRGRLTARGLTPSTGLGAALLASAAQAAVPSLTAEETVRLAVGIRLGRKAAGAVSASEHRLVNGMLRRMLLMTLRKIATTALALAVLAAGVAAVMPAGAEDAQKSSRDAHAQTPRRATEETQAVWRMSLHEAIGIGLRNITALRVIKPPATAAPGEAFLIAPSSNDAKLQNFRTRVMAMLVTIDRLYWHLAQQHLELAARERGVELAREIARREQTELRLGRATPDDVAEAERRLDKASLDLVTKTSDLITAERELRILLGLSAADNRRIVPVTAPTEARLDAEWEPSKAAMLQQLPEILWAKEVAEAAAARHNAAETEKATAIAERVISDAIRSLAKYMLELDSNYKQFKNASRLRAEAAGRLETQRVFWEEGRSAAGPYLDAVGKYVDAVVTEAQFKMAYNVSITALEEAKGTLLEYDKVIVVEPPARTTFADNRQTDETVLESPPAAVMPPAPAPPAISQGGSTGANLGPDAKADGKTYSFHFTIGAGPKPVEVRGSFTITPTRSVDSSGNP